MAPKLGLGGSLQVLKDNAEMPFVVEVTMQADNMLLVFGVRLAEFLQDFNLLHTSLAPASC